MPLNPSGAISLGGPTTGQSIAVELGLSPTATISLNQTNVRTLAQVPSGAIIMPTNFWGKSNIIPTQRAIFAWGNIGPPAFSVRTVNLVTSTGAMGTDQPGTGQLRSNLGAATYGGDKAIFGFGSLTLPGPTGYTNVSNLVSNLGVVAADTPTVGTARGALAAAGFGGDKALFFGGVSPVAQVATSNLVSNTGVVASDTPGAAGVSTRQSFSGATYGLDKAIFGFGLVPGTPISVVGNSTNRVSNLGVVAADTPGVGTARSQAASTTYGGDKAIFAFGVVSATRLNMSNLVSNLGVVASDTPGVGQARSGSAAAGYGGDKAIFAFGSLGPPTPRVNTINLVSNLGVIAANTPSTAQARFSGAAAGYSYSA